MINGKNFTAFSPYLDKLNECLTKCTLELNVQNSNILDDLQEVQQVVKQNASVSLTGPNSHRRSSRHSQVFHRSTPKQRSPPRHLYRSAHRNQEAPTSQKRRRSNRQHTRKTIYDPSASYSGPRMLQYTGHNSSTGNTNLEMVIQCTVCADQVVATESLECALCTRETHLMCDASLTTQVFNEHKQDPTLSYYCSTCHLLHDSLIQENASGEAAGHVTLPHTPTRQGTPPNNQHNVSLNEQHSDLSHNRHRASSNNLCSAPSDNQPCAPSNNQCSAPSNIQHNTTTENPNIQHSAQTDNQHNAPSDNLINAQSDSAPLNNQHKAQTDNQCSVPTEKGNTQHSAKTNNQRSTTPDNQLHAQSDSAPPDKRYSAQLDQQRGAPPNIQHKAQSVNQRTASLSRQYKAPSDNQHRDVRPRTSRQPLGQLPIPPLLVVPGPSVSTIQGTSVRNGVNTSNTNNTDLEAQQADAQKKMKQRERSLKKWEDDLRKQAAEQSEISKQLAASRIVIERLEYEIEQEKHSRKLQDELIKKLQATHAQPTAHEIHHANMQRQQPMSPHQEQLDRHMNQSHPNDLQFLLLRTELENLKLQNQVILNQINQQQTFHQLNHQQTLNQFNHQQILLTLQHPAMFPAYPQVPVHPHATAHPAYSQLPTHPYPAAHPAHPQVFTHPHSAVGPGVRYMQNPGNPNLRGYQHSSNMPTTRQQHQQKRSSAHSTQHQQVIPSEAAKEKPNLSGDATGELPKEETDLNRDVTGKLPTQEDTSTKQATSNSQSDSRTPSPRVLLAANPSKAVNGTPPAEVTSSRQRDSETERNLIDDIKNTSSVTEHSGSSKHHQIPTSTSVHIDAEEDFLGISPSRSNPP